MSQFLKNATMLRRIESLVIFLVLNMKVVISNSITTNQQKKTEFSCGTFEK
jgi:hypothetical protein